MKFHIPLLRLLVGAAGNLIVCLFLTRELHATDLVIEAGSAGNVYSDAKNQGAFNTFRINVVFKPNRPEESPLNGAFRAIFPDELGANVKQYSWALTLPSGQTAFSFVLWPVQGSGPIDDDTCICFTLEPFRDFYGKRRQSATDDAMRGNFEAANEEIVNFNTLCDAIPEDYQPTEGTIERFRHDLLRQVFANAQKYIHSGARAILNEQAQEDRLKIIDNWGLAFVTNSEGYTDRESIVRLIEATSLWWNYAVERHVHRTQTWRTALYGDDGAFLSKQHAQSFRKDFDIIEQCFRNHADVIQAINDYVNTALRNASVAKLNTQLTLWQTWSVPQETDENQSKIGDFGDMINGLYTIYAPSRSSQGSAASR